MTQTTQGNWLARGSRGKQFRPLRVIIYGPDGVGKTAFAMGARPPRFDRGAEDVAVIMTEVGAEAIDGSFRFPRAERWEDVTEQLAELQKQSHPYKKLVIDSVDWLEGLARDYVCRKEKRSSIEDFAYGKGYSMVFDEMRALVMRLEALRDQKEMHIIGVAHSTVRNFKNPEGDDFDRYELKLQATKNSSVVGLWREWPDYVLFANWETLTNKLKNGTVKGITGERVLYTQHAATYDAKSRIALPERLPLSWGAFASAVKDAFERKPEETKQ